MLARRGVAGSVIVLFSIALLASAAMGSPGGLAVPGTVVAIAWLVLAACASLFLTIVVHVGKSEQQAEPKLPRAASTDDLVGMLWDTLVLARPPRADLVAEPVNVPALLAEVCRKYPRLSVTLASGHSTLFTEADPRALGHAFDILIDNACANGQRTTVECDAGASVLVVYIDDDGPGIPRHLRQRVFERQYYMSTPPSQRASCSAALVIAYQNARASGGDLSIGASPMGGARFTLRLPLMDMDGEQADAEPRVAA
jgi:signal transduction histidine kinase